MSLCWRLTSALDEQECVHGVSVNLRESSVVFVRVIDLEHQLQPQLLNTNCNWIPRGNIYIYTRSGWGDESVVLVVLYSFFQSCHSGHFFFFQDNEHHRPGLRSNVTVPETSLSFDRRISRDTPISEPSLLQHRSCPPLAPSHCGDLHRDLCQRDEQARTLLPRGCFFHLLTTFQVSYQSFMSRTSWTTGLSRDGLPESLDDFL